MSGLHYHPPSLASIWAEPACNDAAVLDDVENAVVLAKNVADMAARRVNFWTSDTARDALSAARHALDVALAALEVV